MKATGLATTEDAADAAAFRQTLEANPIAIRYARRLEEAGIDVVADWRAGQEGFGVGKVHWNYQLSEATGKVEPAPYIELYMNNFNSFPKGPVGTVVHEGRHIEDIINKGLTPDYMPRMVDEWRAFRRQQFSLLERKPNLAERQEWFQRTILNDPGYSTLSPEGLPSSLQRMLPK